MADVRVEVSVEASVEISDPELECSAGGVPVDRLEVEPRPGEVIGVRR